MSKTSDGITVSIEIPDSKGPKRPGQDRVSCGDIVGVEHIRKNKVIYEE